MIDFHNHTIPNLDDGPKSVDVALNMYKVAEQQGITDVINTVHYQHSKMENKDTSYDYIISEIKKFNKILKNNSININIHAASEVYYKPNLTEILDNPITTFCNGKYMLVEFHTILLPDNYKNEFYKLMLKGVTPIVAHPERYRFVQNDISLVEEWVQLGYLIQIDCGSILGHFGENTEKITNLLIKKNLCHLIGSDAHNDKKRNFCLYETYMKISEKYGNDYKDFLMKNASKLLNFQSINSFVEKKRTSLFKKFLGKL